MVKKSERGEKRAAPVNRGAWTTEEDRKLVDYVQTHGDKKWRTLPAKAGLKRCGKSCRLRWLNYLRPGIKRGNISEDEEDLIIRIHNLLGNRWSLIAGRLPGRTDNEIKNHWNTHLSKRPLTIDDLNSKLNQTPEGENSPASHATSAAATSAAAEPSNAAKLTSEASLPALDVDDGTFPPLPEFDSSDGGGNEKLWAEEYYNVDVWSDACRSPPSVWFQPTFAAEAFGFDEVAAAFLDYRGCLLPRFI